MSDKKIFKKEKSNIAIGSVIAIIMAILPYAFYYYEALPDWLWDLAFFKALSKSFHGSRLMASWTLFQKLVPLILLLLWFLTCKHWWYHTILIPISLYIFQIYSLLDFSNSYIDTGELYFMVPVVILSLSMTYLARLKIFDKIHGIDISEIEESVKKPSDLWFK
ncbi:hypothetical protein [uncultured Nonlabens sp.]|uniref:hypothetical protein n=1 Tax=uncultured Nonlabens sp. TaxID=859306 RepID=UPI002616B08F|nr:hypothetical protein [uncultured Nonlabens sp.]